MIVSKVSYVIASGVMEVINGTLHEVNRILNAVILWVFILHEDKSKFSPAQECSLLTVFVARSIVVSVIRIGFKVVVKSDSFLLFEEFVCIIITRSV